MYKKILYNKISFSISPISFVGAYQIVKINIHFTHPVYVTFVFSNRIMLHEDDIQSNYITHDGITTRSDRRACSYVKKASRDHS
jgi:hypothetical protein